MDPDRWIRRLPPRWRRVWRRAEDRYAPLRPLIPGSPPLWLVVVVAVGGGVGVLLIWGLMAWIMGGWRFWWRVATFLSEATQVYDPSAP